MQTYPIGKWLITLRSANKKTGPIMVTTSPADTCPDVCPLKRAGCYADSGPLRMLWDRMTATPLGDTFKSGKANILVQGMDALESAIMRQHGALWRHNQAGDLHHVAGRIVNELLSFLARVNETAKARGFTYTHHAVLGNSPMAAHNRGAISAANSMGFAVNLSGNNPRHADKLATLNIAPVVTMVADETVTATPAGRKIEICPAQLDEHTTCHNCGKCALIDRDFIIGFVVHGTSVKKAAEIASK